MTKKTEPKAAFACLFKVDLGGKTVYFVRLNPDKAVHGFKTLRDGLNYFEHGYNDAIARGGGWMAGACINLIQLQPRIFRFMTLARLKKIVGDKGHVESLTSNAVHELGIRCGNQAAAARAYKSATRPLLRTE
jgi:hypothetical protein